MRGVDTNVLVRLFARDDAEQEQRARRWFAQGPVFVSRTVLLETEWVLRRLLGFDRAAIAAALMDVVRAPGAVIERASDVAWALERFRQGADFADMLHLAGAQGCTEFATFDRDLARAPSYPGLPTVLEL